MSSAAFRPRHIVAHQCYFFLFHRLAERGRMKCDPYWPAEPWETVDYGKFKVVNKGIANKGDYQITLLEATNKEVGIYIFSVRID